jgi:hypothetical protein
MEAAALNAPPAWLERIVLGLIPPGAREAVAGDLCETYASPRQYAHETLRTVPLVILSQMRRNLNLPALLLQTGLVYFCLGPAAASLALPVLLLNDTYQPITRPCPRRALRAAILIASAALVFLQAASLTMGAAIRADLDRATWMSLLFLGPMLSPLMGLCRAGLIVDGDHRSSLAASEMSAPELEDAYRRFAGRTRWHNMLEGAALFAAGSFASVFLRDAVSIPLIALYLLAAVYLLLHGALRMPEPQADFVSLRAHFQSELTRRQRQRHFLWWLWFAPVLAALYLKLVEAMLANGKPMLAVLGSVAAILSCFLITALTREYSGRIQEQVGLLDRMREKMSGAEIDTASPRLYRVL